MEFNTIRYFKETWVGTPPRRGQWQPARFEVAIWNTHDAALRDQHRTNNNLEGWHTRFETMIGTNHPTICRCIEGFFKEQNMSRVRNIQFRADANPPPSRKKYRLLEHRIRNVVTDFTNRNAMDYLRSIAHNLSIVN
ncbi:unnamed protein product [Allacma fusca]|uniref:Uncharacterized protein n=1 Tax=Allacma fusca TaxID=39272 RepID=A0A8J2L6I2_9HEXA|nr:unnamed protein product [Allacma fusca]